MDQRTHRRAAEPRSVGRPAHRPRSPYGAALRRARVDSGLTLTDLAERAELTIGMISLIERGQRWPSVAARNRLERVLGADRLWEALR